jgi:uncharacterized phosphosugar-binding protein
MIDAIGDFISELSTKIEEIAEGEREPIEQAGQIVAHAIADGGFTFVCGTGHSRAPVEEMFPRFGSFPGFYPVSPLSTTNHASVLGPNGHAVAIAVENAIGVGAVVFESLPAQETDAALIFSHSGRHAMTVEIAEAAHTAGLSVVAVVSVQCVKEMAAKYGHSGSLLDFADVVVDTHAPPSDALLDIPGFTGPIGSVSTILSCIVANAIKCSAAGALSVMRRALPTLDHPTRSLAPPGVPPLAVAEFARRLGLRYSQQSQGDLG